MRPRLDVVEIAEGVGTPAEMRRREAAAIGAALPGGAFVAALDLGGEMLDSAAFAQRIATWADAGRGIAWVIGGAEGLDPGLVQRADARISLGALTWPHLLVRVMLAEQLFRAQCIDAGHPYHRPWRP